MWTQKSMKASRTDPVISSSLLPTVGSRLTPPCIGQSCRHTIQLQPHYMEEMNSGLAKHAGETWDDNEHPCSVLTLLAAAAAAVTWHMHTHDGFNKDQFVMNQGHLVTISSTTATVSYQCWSHRGRDFGLEADQSCPWPWRFADFWRIPVRGVFQRMNFHHGQLMVPQNCPIILTFTATGIWVTKHSTEAF